MEHRLSDMCGNRMMCGERKPTTTYRCIFFFFVFIFNQNARTSKIKIFNEKKKNHLAEPILVGNFILADRMNFSVKPLA